MGSLLRSPKIPSPPPIPTPPKPIVPPKPLTPEAQDARRKKQGSDRRGHAANVSNQGGQSGLLGDT